VAQLFQPIQAAVKLLAASHRGMLWWFINIL